MLTIFLFFPRNAYTREKAESGNGRLNHIYHIATCFAGDEMEGLIVNQNENLRLESD